MSTDWLKTSSKKNRATIRMWYAIGLEIELLDKYGAIHNATESDIDLLDEPCYFNERYRLKSPRP